MCTVFGSDSSPERPVCAAVFCMAYHPWGCQDAHSYVPPLHAYLVPTPQYPCAQQEDFLLCAYLSCHLYDIATGVTNSGSSTVGVFTLRDTGYASIAAAL